MSNKYWDIISSNFDGKFGWVQTTIDLVVHTFQRIMQIPGLKQIGNLIVWYKDKMVEIYKRFAYVDGVVHKDRALYSIGGILVGTYLLFLQVIPFVWNVTGDVGSFVFTHDREMVYTTGGQTLDESIDLHRVSGCYELPCSASNTIYYHVEPNWVQTVRTIFSRGEWFYPEDIIAAIPNQVSKCEIESVWFRWKALEWFPKIVNVESCHPIKQEEMTSM